jgi:hypothetical protein
MYPAGWSGESSKTAPSTSTLLLNLDGYSDDDETLPVLDTLVSHREFTSSPAVASHLCLEREQSTTSCEERCPWQYLEDASPKGFSTDTASTSISRADCDSSSSIGSSHESDESDELPTQLSSVRLDISDMLCWRCVAVDQGYHADPNLLATARIMEQVEKVRHEKHDRRTRTKREHKTRTERPISHGLELSSNSWAAKQRYQRGSSEADDVLRKTRSILNKLTLETFPRLYQHLVSCGIKTAQHMIILIDELFEKATTQHHFIDMYADLCVQLHAFFSKHPVSADPKDDFKRVLLISCQRSFERHLTSRTSVESDLRPENGHKFRTHMLGNIRFVGALATRNMLAGKVLISVMEELLAEPTSETLESLAALLTVVGATFDTALWPHHNVFIAVMEQVTALSKSRSVATRVQCLLKDVIDLRANGWMSQRPKQFETPRKLDGTSQAAVISQVGLGVVKTTFDADVFRREMKQVFAELRVTHDGGEAAQRIGPLLPPQSQQAEEVCTLIVEAIQLSFVSARKAGFELITKLFLDHEWSPLALCAGLHLFVTEVQSDLIHDLPKLPVLVRDEFVPAMACLLSAGILSSSDLESLNRCFESKR